MKKRTLDKLLHDPKFDPAAFLEPAITQYLNRNPGDVAKDQVAIKYLVDDEEVVQLIWEAIDINDPDLMNRFFNTLAKAGQWNREDVCASLLGRFKELDPDKADEIFAVLKRAAPKFQAISRPSYFNNLSNFIAEDKLFELMESALADKRGTIEWTVGDWQVAQKVEAGKVAFLKALEEDRIPFKTKTDDERNFFRFISQFARVVQGTPHASELLRICEARWDAFVCFACGRGSGVDRYGNMNATNTISSISGYTLHTNTCHSGFPSPWLTINGQERELQFECDRCGIPFTTASGLTLHQKKC